MRLVALAAAVAESIKQVQSSYIAFQEAAVALAYWVERRLIDTRSPMRLPSALLLIMALGAGCGSSSSSTGSTKATSSGSTSAITIGRGGNAAVTVSPTSPYVDEAVTVRIHASKPLPAGDVYTVFVVAEGGNPSDGFSHFGHKNTTSTSVTIGPLEAIPRGKAWAAGNAHALVSQVSHSEAEEVGFAPFRFRKRP
jgi:hypothetical protein